MQRPAKPRTPVQFRPRPPYRSPAQSEEALKPASQRFFWCARHGRTPGGESPLVTSATRPPTCGTHCRKPQPRTSLQSRSRPQLPNCCARLMAIRDTRSRSLRCGLHRCYSSVPANYVRWRGASWTWTWASGVSRPAIASCAERPMRTPGPRRMLSRCPPSRGDPARTAPPDGLRIAGVPRRAQLAPPDERKLRQRWTAPTWLATMPIMPVALVVIDYSRITRGRNSASFP